MKLSNCSRIGVATYLVLATLFLALGASALDEIVDRRIPYQGRLEGVAGSVNLLVELYDAPLGGNRIWGPEPHLVTPDAEGRFLIVIGSTSLDLCARQPDESLLCGASDGIADLDQIQVGGSHLSIQVDDGVTTTQLDPRQPLFPSFAAATATVALGAAEGAIDSLAIEDNSITGVDVQDGSIGGVDIADSSITGADIAFNTVSGADIADNGITISDLSSSVGQSVPPTEGGRSSVILATGGDCPTFKGATVYTNIGNYVLNRVGGGTGTFTLCRQ